MTGRKVKWLADNGFALCTHALWHAQLNKFSHAELQELIARGDLAIDSVLGAKPVTEKL